jgi:hypothetical protein
MKHRKLRIAWSVGWGVVAMMLIVLWVRSYWWHEIFRYNGRNVIAGVSTYAGGITAYWHVDRGFGIWEYLRHPAHAGIGARYGYQREGDDLRICVPIAVVFIVLTALSMSVWLPWRFSLRTLLIATTLVTVALGLFVFFMRIPSTLPPTYAGDLPADYYKLSPATRSSDKER